MKKTHKMYEFSNIIAIFAHRNLYTPNNKIAEQK